MFVTEKPVKKNTSPLSPENLAKMKKGEGFATEGLFQGLSKTHCNWVLISGNKGVGEYLFEVYYLNIKLGEFCAFVDGDKVKLEVL